MGQLCEPIGPDREVVHSHLHIRIEMLSRTRQSLLIACSLLTIAIWSEVLRAQQAGGPVAPWSDPVILYQTTGTAIYPRLVADSQGDVHLFFVYRGSTEALMYTRLHGGSWSPPLGVLVSPDGGQVNLPAVTVDTQGFLHVVWRGGSLSQIYYSRAHVSQADSAQGWTKPVGLSSGSGFNSDILAGSDGKLHFVYARVGGDVYYRQSIDGGHKWTSGIAVSKAERSNAATDYPRIAVDQRGSLHVVWTQFPPSSWPPAGGFYSRSLDGGQSWAEPLQIAAEKYGLINVVTIGTDAVHLVWNATVDIGDRMHQWSSDGGDTWTPPQKITDKIKGGFTGFSVLAIDGNNVLHLVTSVNGQEGKTEDVYYLVWNGEAWSDPVLLSTGTVGEKSVELPWMVVSNGDRLHVVYEDDFERIWYTSRMTNADATQTRMIFPRILYQQGRFTGIAIANPNSAAADVTFRAYNLDGTPVGNPVVKRIAGGSQYARLASEILSPPASAVFGSTPTRQWLEVTSATDGLTGFFLEGNDALDFMDGGTLAENGTDLMLPIVENTGGSTTEISIVNPDPADLAQVVIDFIRSDGSIVSSQSTSIPKRGAIQGPLAGFFNVSYDAVAGLRVRSDRPVVCYGSVFRQSDNSLITIAAQNVALPAKTINFPQLAQGEGWSTLIGLANVTSAQVLVTITAYKPDGMLFTAPTVSENPVTRIIPAGGIFRSSAQSLFGFNSSALQIGWIKAEANAAAIHGYVEYGAGSNRAVVAGQVSGYARAIFSHQALQPPFFTGLAVLNPGAVATNVEVVSLNADGYVVGKTERVLKPRQSEALLIQQWIPAAAGLVGGSVFVKSDAPTIATQLFGTDSLAALANIPPQPVSTSFDPGGALPKLTVVPPLAVVETGKTQMFNASGIPNVNWAVDGIQGDNIAIGTISTIGLYSAPGIAPAQHTLDLLSFNVQRVMGNWVLTVTFDQPVVPPRGNAPNSLTGFIDSDFQKGGQLSHAVEHNLFNETLIFDTDAYIDLSKEILTNGTQTFPVSVQYLGKLLSIRIPDSLIDITNAKITIVAGNRLEITDFAPNSGSIRLR